MRTDSETSTPLPLRPPVGSETPWLQWRGPQTFVWRSVPLPVARLPRELDGLRVLHLSDFHTRHYWPPAYDGLLSRIAVDPPDLILFTGDFVEHRTKQLPAVPHVRRLVEGLHARLGCFGTLGNHDRYHFARHLHDTRVTLIENQRLLLHQGLGTIELIGLPGVHCDDLDESFLRSIPPRGEGTLRVVLSHFPDHFLSTRSLHADLFLSGHTHGGQVCLPNGQALITHSRLPRKLCQGIHPIGDTWLVVSRGMGYSGLPLRTFCPSEAVELTLRRR